MARKARSPAYCGFSARARAAAVVGNCVPRAEHLRIGRFSSRRTLCWL